MKSFQERQDELAAHYAAILPLLGEAPEREGLVKTPIRVARAMLELTRGYTEDPIAILRSALFKETYHNMVVVKDIEFYSLCEHHMLPFFGHAHIAYIPNGEITGLSKLARIVNTFSHRLQVQERMTEQIAECIHEALNPLGVMVVVEGRHLCMQMRGVAKQNAHTVTMHHLGAFDDPALRAEFLSQLRGEARCPSPIGCSEDEE
ncbi:MAG: GTP cyclohydrolase I FolE [Bacteroidaceae bacterium]|nr:GTP cyclohydrolase I FolE [Bacteroidaceae bacterium]